MLKIKISSYNSNTKNKLEAYSATTRIIVHVSHIFPSDYFSVYVEGERKVNNVTRIMLMTIRPSYAKISIAMHIIILVLR